MAMGLVFLHLVPSKISVTWNTRPTTVTGHMTQRTVTTSCVNPSHMTLDRAKQTIFWAEIRDFAQLTRRYINVSDPGQNHHQELV